MEIDAAEDKAFAGMRGLLEDHMGLLTTEDVANLAVDIPENTSALIILFEHRWAEHLKDAIKDAGGFLVARETIPPEVLVALNAELEAAAVVGA
jgi:hypothetical protein